MHILNKPLFHVLLIVIVVFLAYSNTFQVPFQRDDIPNIVENPAIKEFRYFTTSSRIPSSIESGDINTDFINKTQQQPLLKLRSMGFLTFTVNYALGGLEVGGYHLVNILIHAANAVLLYWIIILTFRTPCFPVGNGAGRVPAAVVRDLIALFTALFFAVHPIQTQAVTYIVQRFASLATFFFLLALLMYIKFRLSSLKPGAASLPFTSPARLKRYAAYGVSLVSVVLAMKTKEFSMLLPVVITLYEFMFFEGSVKKRLPYLVPFGLTMVIIPITMLSMSGSLSNTGGIDGMAAQVTGVQGGISRTDYLFTQFRVIVTYIRLLFLPIDQAFDYDYPIFHSFFEPQVTISFLLLLSIFAGGLFLYRRSRVDGTKDQHLYRLGSFGIFWFFLTLSAESSIVPIADVIFEHRVYLPSVGFFISLSSIVALASARWDDRTGAMNKTPVTVLALLVLALSVATFSRNIIWQSAIRQLEDDVRKSPGKFRLHRALGIQYAAQGRMTDALYHMRTAMDIYPYDAEIHYRLGLAYAALGRMEQAIYEYKFAIRCNVNYADAHNDLGIAYGKLRRFDEAIKEFSIALMIVPNSADTRINLGFAYEKSGRPEKALNEYRTALRLKPDLLEARRQIERISPEKEHNAHGGQ